MKTNRMTAKIIVQFANYNAPFTTYYDFDKNEDGDYTTLKKRVNELMQSLEYFNPPIDRVDIQTRDGDFFTISR